MTENLDAVAYNRAAWDREVLVNWRGPYRDGISAETGLLKSWPEQGPKLLWTFTKAGVGYSAPAIVGNRFYTMGARGESEFLIVLDIRTGKAAGRAQGPPTRPGRGDELVLLAGHFDAVPADDEHRFVNFVRDYCHELPEGELSQELDAVFNHDQQG